MLFNLSGLYLMLMSVVFMIMSLMMLLFKLSFFIEWLIYSFNSVSVNYLIYVDWMTMMFIFVVMLISSMIMYYSGDYMSHDNYKIRFFYLMILFITSMLLMVISPNMISLLLGWDGLGLVSYGLVIYYQNNSSFNSGMLTVLMNRVGDVMIIISISIMFMYGSWNYVNYYKMLFIIMMLVIVASFTKSAQFPFSSWLPAAMAAPTPVSSLVHSSTLVTAGVYLLIRFKSLIYLNNNLLMYIMITGLLTMMMAGFSACFEFDIKKIIAFSTLSQLGLMMMIYSMKFSDLAYFHLVIHAMFKSMMFMCSGIMIHSMNNYQDIRYMGLLLNLMPLTSMMFMVGNLSLCGMPFFSGFYSKDKILESMFMENISNLIYLFLMLSTAMTVFYSFRLCYYLMYYKFSFMVYLNIKDWKIMNNSMIILTFLSLIMGWMLNWLLYTNIDMIYLMIYQKLSVLVMLLVSLIMMNILFKKFIKKLWMLNLFFGKMWFINNMNFFYNVIFISNGLKLINLYDKGWSEYLMKNSLIKYINMFKKLNFSFNNLIMLFLLISYMIMMLMLIY
nr:NADH dehydrogenase subunit 5 [Merostenus sp.]